MPINFILCASLSGPNRRVLIEFVLFIISVGMLEVVVLFPCDKAVVSSATFFFFKVSEAATTHFGFGHAEAGIFIFVVKFCILQIEHFVKVVQYSHYYEEGEDYYQRDLTFLNIFRKCLLFVSWVKMKQIHTDVVQKCDQRKYHILIVSEIDTALERHQNHCHYGHIVINKLDVMTGIFEEPIKVDE